MLKLQKKKKKKKKKEEEEEEEEKRRTNSINFHARGSLKMKKKIRL